MVGRNDMNEKNPPNSNIFKVKKVFVHDDFYGWKADMVNDVGILLLKTRLKFGKLKIKKINLPKKNTVPRKNAKCRTAGIIHV